MGPAQGSQGCSAGIGQNRWAWSLPQKCIRCYKPTLEIPASSSVSGISIPFEVPPKVSCSLPKNLRTQARASYCLSAQPCCGGCCRKESCREGKRLNLEVSVLSPPSNQQSPSESRGALPALVVVSEDKDRT